MKILVVHNYYQERGGEDSVFENEIKELEKRGYEIVKYTKHNNDLKNINFLKKILFFFSSIYNFNTIKEIKKILKENKDIKIAHIHNTFPIISPSIYSILKKYKIKIVQTIHNYRFICPNGLFYVNDKICTLCNKSHKIFSIIKRCYKNSIIFSILYFLIVTLNQRVFKKKIDCYIVLNDFVKNILIENGFKKEKIFIKDNMFVDNSSYRRESKGYFLYLGRISKEKGIEFLIDFFCNHKEFNLIIAGSGKNIEEIQKKATDNIKFIGFISGEDKDKLISESIALIVPSIWYENYPVVVVESFQKGIPVIASNIGGLPYIIKDRYNGFLFESLNKDQLLEKIKLIIDNPNLREIMGENARKTFLERMESQKNIDYLIEIYKNIL